MLGFFSLWRQGGDSTVPPSVAQEQGRRIDKATIGVPVLLSLPRRFEIYAGAPAGVPAGSRAHRSCTASTPSPLPPTIRPPPPTLDKVPHYPLIRSYSLPVPVCSRPTASSVQEGASAGEGDAVSAPPAARSNSCSPLHLDIRRPLSPILEQSCASPISLKPISPLLDEISPLDLSRPSARSSSSVQRSLNISQQVASTPPDTPSSAISAQPPSLPPLRLVPYFPGPHPSQEGYPPRRPPKAFTLPVRSSVYSAAASSSGSLHAESFVTAKSIHLHADADNASCADVPFDLEAPPVTVSRSATSSTHAPYPPAQLLDRHGTVGSAGTGSSSLRRKRQRFAFATPAFCMFWLGFLFPPLWWVGGWYFTLFTETPWQRTLWEHYVRRTRWWALLTCGLGAPPVSGERSAKNRPPKALLLPRWVRAGNAAPALDGIAYYYPFVSRPAPGEPGHVTTGPAPNGFRRLHRWFDEMTRSRLEWVKITRESPRRIIDPWIGRCRRALCYWCVIFLLFVLGMMGWSFAVGAGKAQY